MNDFLTRQLKAISRVEQLSSPLLSSSPLPLGPSVRPSSVGAGGRGRRRKRLWRWKWLSLREDRKSALAIALAHEGGERLKGEEEMEGALG